MKNILDPHVKYSFTMCEYVKANQWTSKHRKICEEDFFYSSVYLAHYISDFCTHLYTGPWGRPSRGPHTGNNPSRPAPAGSHTDHQTETKKTNSSIRDHTLGINTEIARPI